MDAAQFDSAPGQPYAPSMDHDLIDEVALYNPFRRGNSWPGLKKKKLEMHPSLSARAAKSLRDRTLLLMDRRRHRSVQRTGRKSGIDVPPPNSFETAIDEAILLKQEAEKEERPKFKTLQADTKVVPAAEAVERGEEPADTSGAVLDLLFTRGTGASRIYRVHPLTAACSFGPCFQHGPNECPEIKRRRELGSTEDKEEREEAEQLRKREMEAKAQAEAERQRAELRAQEAQQQFMIAQAEEDRKLKREELELRKRELALRERKEAAESEERKLLFELLKDKFTKQ
ncbi:hypothetical protein BaRGS_00012573 [Batillaria attramentaria]|uniref:Uncharacterized protein n=1 Tax=Batillaria attramentaria TaxID=370345 RepID=A0ABD0L9X3_9CAEN